MPSVTQNHNGVTFSQALKLELLVACINHGAMNGITLV